MAHVNWLVRHRDDAGLVVVDCLYDESAYARAHIPGAVARRGHSSPPDCGRCCVTTASNRSRFTPME